MADQKSVAIVGAGLCGSLLAAMLGRRGMAVDLYERRADPRLSGAERGRSINLAISARGLDSLERVGLRDVAMAKSLPMYGRTMHGQDSGIAYQSYSADGTRAINSISRSELNHALLDCAESAPGVRVHFGHRLVQLDPMSGEMQFATDDGPVGAAAETILAGDGAFSAARAAVQFRAGFDFSQDFLQHGYKELTIPAGPDGKHVLDPRSLHIWPRGSAMMIALPNLDGSFTCTLFWPKTGEGGLETLVTADEITAFFAANYPDVIDLMPTLVDDYQYNPVGSLVTVRCWPWVTGRVALIGDAAHAIVPFYGQGANCAMEDCVELLRCLDETGQDWARALPEFERRRKPNADAIANYALLNFVEMRESVGSKVFRAKTAAHHALERVLAGRFVSRYELVSFSTLPYAQIAPRLRKQNAIVGGASAAVAIAGTAAATLLLRRLMR